MGSQNVKKEATSPPNGNPEKPKGASGKGRSPLNEFRDGPQHNFKNIIFWNVELLVVFEFVEKVFNVIRKCKNL